MLFVSMLNGTSNQEYYLRGNKAYKECAYEDALRNYEQIEKKGDAVWHNMGNCCYYLQRYDDARVYWQRAQRHASYEDYCALATNIALLDVSVTDDTNVAYESWLFWVRARTASRSLLLIQIITVCVWFLFFIALRKRAHWGIIFVCFVLSIFLVWLSIDMHKQRCQRYAVSREEIPVYVGPNNSYHQEGAVPHARSVVIVDERDGWYKIAHKELAGWVQADKLIQV